MDMINHYETLINSRIEAGKFLNNALKKSASCTITLMLDGDGYIIPHWMRKEIIAAIIKENELSIDRLNRKLKHYKNK